MQNKRSIETGDIKIEYTLRQSRVSRCIRITVKPGGLCTVSAPSRVSLGRIEGFIKEKIDWIHKKIQDFSRIPPAVSKRENRAEYLKLKEQARIIAQKRVTHFANRYGLAWNKIAIRNQKTRWGSCSRSGNLNFSYKLAQLSDDLADYLVVHEVCHLKEFNHSPRFWKLVEKEIPDYLERRTRLRRAGMNSPM